MVTIQTKTLEGRLLDIAVAMVCLPSNPEEWLNAAMTNRYSANHDKCSKLIADRVTTLSNFGTHWRADGLGLGRGEGPTHMVAVARCVVSDKFGDLVDIPDDLLE